MEFPSSRAYPMLNFLPINSLEKKGSEDPMQTVEELFQSIAPPDPSLNKSKLTNRLKKIATWEPNIPSDNVLDQLSIPEQKIILDILSKWACSSHQNLFSLFGMEISNQLDGLKITRIIIDIKEVFHMILFNISLLNYHEKRKVQNFPTGSLYPREEIEGILLRLITKLNSKYNKAEICKINNNIELLLKVFRLSKNKEFLFCIVSGSNAVPIQQRNEFTASKEQIKANHINQPQKSNSPTLEDLLVQEAFSFSKPLKFSAGFQQLENIKLNNQRITPLEEINFEIKILDNLICYTNFCRKLLLSHVNKNYLFSDLKNELAVFQKLTELFKALQKEKLQEKTISEDLIKEVIIELKKLTLTLAVTHNATLEYFQDETGRYQAFNFDFFISHIHTLFDKMFVSPAFQDYSPIMKNRNRFLNLIFKFPNETPFHEVMPSPIPSFEFNQVFCECLAQFEDNYTDELNKRFSILKTSKYIKKMRALNKGYHNAFWITTLTNLTDGMCHHLITIILTQIKNELISIQQKVINSLKNELGSLPHNGISQQEAAALKDYINDVTYHQSQFIISIVTIYEDLDTISSENVTFEPKQFPTELANLVKLEGLEELIESYIKNPEEPPSPLLTSIASSNASSSGANVSIGVAKKKKKKTQKVKNEKRIRDIEKRHQLIKRLKAEGFYKAGRQEGHANPGHDIYLQEGVEQSLIAVPRHDQISIGVRRTIEDQVEAARELKVANDSVEG